MNINAVLEKAPAVIASATVKENEAYAIMITTHEEYKQIRAKKYLEAKVAAPTIGLTIKDLEYTLDIDVELIAIKQKETSAEIDYRAWRQKKDNARDFFNAAQELGRTRRAEMKSLGDSV